MYNPEESGDESGEPNSSEIDLTKSPKEISRNPLDFTKEQAKQENKQLNDNDDKMFSERKKVISAYKEATGIKVSRELVKII